MAEVHLIGQIVKAVGFEEKSLFIRWTLDSGSYWKIVEGHSKGQSQLTTKGEFEQSLFSKSSSNNNNNNTTELDEDDSSSQHWFNHPLDVHYACTGLKGWPRFEFQVWAVDWLQRCNISAYGHLSVPMQPGLHKLQCNTWRPVGDLRRRVVDFITGNRLQLIDPSNIVSNGLNRHIIQTQPMGCVDVELSIIMRDFDKFGIEVFV